MSMSTSAATPRGEPFRIDVHPERDAVRVVPIGELDLASVGELDDQLQELGAAGFERLVLDLRRLQFIDSSGLHLILKLDSEARGLQRQFTVIPGPPAIQRLFELTGVGGRLTVERRVRIDREDRDQIAAPPAGRDSTFEEVRPQVDAAESPKPERLPDAAGPGRGDAPDEPRAGERRPPDTSSGTVHSVSVLDLGRDRQAPPAA